MFKNIYKGKRVLITGHTGFKGSWLALWLTELGADVIGYAIEPLTKPNHFELLKLKIKSIVGNILDINLFNNVLEETKPEIVFHLAAQALVRESYINPLETLQTNIIGTANVLETCRKSDSVRAIINVTSDKCYENKEWIWGYRESDPMGGFDPYSASKACSEIITASFRNSFFNKEGDNRILIASARAGNVIGGGDWAKDRLVPDIVKAANHQKKVFIRNPHAVRPWQHVLEPLSGYLLLGQKLLESKTKYAEAWNFGPADSANIAVGDVIAKMSIYWDKIEYNTSSEQNLLHEASLLMLDCTKANNILKWKAVWNFDETINATIKWYKAYYNTGIIKSRDDLMNYIKKAEEKNLIWCH